MTARIGINPNTWALDDVPELKNFSTLEQCLSEAHACGYTGIEMGGILPKNSKGLKDALDPHKLTLAAGWYDGHLYERDVADEFESALSYLTLLRDAGASCVVYADCTNETFSNPTAPMSSRPRLNADEWRSYGRKVTYLAEMMADLGMPMAFHHHIGTIVESDQDVDNLMRHTGPAVGLLLDTGHSILAGGDPVRLSENHANRIVHFHGKDTRAHVLERAIAEDWSFLTAVMANVYTVPGDGNIDYYPILRSLHDTGYKGWLIVEAEQDLRMANPLTYARLGYGNLSRMAADAGLAVTT